jgi:hypothetical protein
MKLKLVLYTYYKHHPEYLFNLAATDFPLKTNNEITTYLSELNGRSDVETIEERDDWKFKYSFEQGPSFP